MNVETIIQKLETDGIVVSVVGDNIRLTASAHCPIEPHIISAVRRQKPAMIKYLRARADRSLEEEMKVTGDAFWQAARPAGRKIESLPHLGEAMAYLRHYHPEFYWLLTEFWLERLRSLWEAGKLREFREALRVWVMMHAELCKAYQRFRLLER